jgi:hypothetical protein
MDDIIDYIKDINGKPLLNSFDDLLPTRQLLRRVKLSLAAFSDRT